LFLTVDNGDRVVELNIDDKAPQVCPSSPRSSPVEPGFFMHKNRRSSFSHSAWKMGENRPRRVIVAIDRRNRIESSLRKPLRHRTLKLE
jgi:hypothetical protein